MSGFIGLQSQAAMVITLNVVALVFYLPVSYSLAISALVGSALGKGNVYQAKKISIIAIILTSMSILCVVTLICGNATSLVSVYTRDPPTVQLASSNLQAYCMIMLLDGFQYNLQAIIKGLGLQEKAQYLSLISMFLVGLPCAYFACFKMSLGINGLWYGFAAGLVIQSILFGSLICKSDWHKISQDIQAQYEDCHQDLEIAVTHSRNDSKVSQKDDDYHKI